MNVEEEPNNRHFDEHSHNFLAFVLNMVSMRIGWIFKTESVIMPGFLDTLTGSSAVRGFLPLISRLGQSLPQFVIAHRVTNFPLKKWAFFYAAILLCVPWGLLSLALWLIPGIHPYLMVGVFLATYTFHWVVYGANFLLSGTLQGKLIDVLQRGRLLAISTSLGCVLAIFAAYFFLPKWLMNGGKGYALVFGATCLFFAVAAVAVLLLRETKDSPDYELNGFRQFAASSAALIGSHANFRWFIIVISLHSVTRLLFPHYTVFGMRTMGVKPSGFVQWLIAQNFINALGSVVMGLLADRYGNRIILRLLIFIGGCVPLVAIGISKLPGDLGYQLYWIVFAFIGFTPVSMKIITNYTLEISPVKRHPQYLGTLNVIQMLPLLTSPLIGWMIDRFSFQSVFIFCSMMIFVGALMTFRLEEPRRDR
ncbi:TPA: MFS transporter [Candidatus Poribacteria bacterium]|nr:MFS transporter [Candidatus Poribacteria bacterium]